MEPTQVTPEEMQAAADQQQGSHMQHMCVMLWNSQLTSVQTGDGGGFFILEQHHIIYPTKNDPIIFIPLNSTPRLSNTGLMETSAPASSACGIMPVAQHPGAAAPSDPRSGVAELSMAVYMRPGASSQCRSQPMG